MSIREFLHDRELSTYDKVIFLLLLNESEKGKTSLSQVEISEIVGCTRPTVAKSIKKLEDMDLIVKERQSTKFGGRDANIYHIKNYKLFLK